METYSTAENNRSESPFLLSVMIPTYNRADLLRETLQSVLVQYTASLKMEIWVVDDCSPADDPKLVVDEIGAGVVQFYRQDKNVGQMLNINKCIELASGELVHILHSDDRVLPGFYQKVTEAFNAFPSAGAFFTRHVYMDNEGSWIYLSPALSRKTGFVDNWFEKIATRQLIQTPSIVVKKSVYDDLGRFNTLFTWCEDWEMWVRISHKYPICYIHQVLAEYRHSSVSNTADSIRTGRFIDDLSLAIREIFRYHRNQNIFMASHRYYSSYIHQQITHVSLSSLGRQKTLSLFKKAILFSPDLLGRIQMTARLSYLLTIRFIEKLYFRFVNKAL